MRIFLSYGHDARSNFQWASAESFFQYFQRQFPDLEKFRKDVRPALRAILAAREPLPVEILQRLFNWQDEELRDFTRPLASLFPTSEETEAKVIKPFHKSIPDWLTDEATAGAYFVSINEGQRVLADFCWRDYKQGVEQMANFSVRYAPFFLRQVGRKDDAKALMGDVAFRNRRLHLGFGRIHLCFSWRDNEIARRIGNNLEGRGHTVLTTEDEGFSAQPWHEIERKTFEAADLYLFLVSPAFMASSFPHDIQMPQAIKRFKSGESEVFPVILKRCDWMRSPLAQWQAYPRDCIPIEDRENGPEWVDALCEKLHVWFAQARQRHVFDRLFGSRTTEMK